MIDTESDGTLVAHLYTIGHSDRSLEDLLELLKAYRIERVADVRTAAGSRRNPQFMKGKLADALTKSGIAYSHMPALGGFRKALPDSINTAWRNDSFRGFADYMQSEDFSAALSELIQLAERERVVVMCAEAVPWRCHRSLIADAMTARGATVRHITSPKRADLHKMTPFAQVSEGRVTYPELGSET